MSDTVAEAVAGEVETQAKAAPRKGKPAAAPAGKAVEKAPEASVFKPLADLPGGSAPRSLDAIMAIPVTLSVELGTTRMSIHELLDLARGSIVELEGLAGDPMNILVNGHMVAQGEVVVVDDKYGIRITEIADQRERVSQLGR